MCRAIQCFIVGDESVNIESMKGLEQTDSDQIKALLQEIKHENGEERHAAWLTEIEKGVFSFGAEKLAYIPKGEGSWKHTAIGQLASSDGEDEVLTYSPEFLTSDWKSFHDVLQAHRFDVLHDVLPKYGICAA